MDRRKGMLDTLQVQRYLTSLREESLKDAALNVKRAAIRDLKTRPQTSAPRPQR